MQKMQQNYARLFYPTLQFLKRPSLFVMLCGE